MNQAAEHSFTSQPRTRGRGKFQPMGANLAVSILFHLAIGAAAMFLPGKGAIGPGTTWIELSSWEGAIHSPTKPASRAITTLPPQTSAIPETALPDESSSAEQQEIQPAETQVVAEPQPLPILASGLTRGFFKSLREGESLRSDIKDYYLELLSRINESWRVMGIDGATEPGRKEAMVSISIGRGGEILHLSIVQSSGSQTYDRLIIQAVQGSAPLPPLPDTYKWPAFQAPLRLTAPSSLSFS